MQPIREDDADSLAGLEERIRQAVTLVSSLKQQKDAIAKELEAALTAREDALAEASEARALANRYAQELDALRSERRQVRTRLEKLKGQLDLLGEG